MTAPETAAPAAAPTNFTDWLRDRYRADPGRLRRYAGDALYVVGLRRRRWRGRRHIKGALVVVPGLEQQAAQLPSGETVAPAEKTHTDPQWVLLPDEDKEQFEALEQGVAALIEQYAANADAEGGRKGKGDDEEDEEQVNFIGRGLYVIDAASYPRLKDLMQMARTQWARAADALCTEDGYAALHERVRAKFAGHPGAYEQVIAPLVPDRDALRAKFGLFFTRLPFRFDAGLADSGSQPAPADAAADEAEGAGRLAVEALELAVRKPRARLTRVLTALAEQLVAREPDGTLSARQVTQTTAAGQTLKRPRVTRAKSLQAARRAVVGAANWERFLGPELRAALDAVLAELPEAGGDAYAKKLRCDDRAALHLGRLLVAAADCAADEAAMCRVLEEAL